jgi:hypothetical protein
MKFMIFGAVTYVVLRKLDISEEHVTSVFRVKGKQSKKPAETDDSHSSACHLLVQDSCLA